MKKNCEKKMKKKKINFFIQKENRKSLELHYFCQKPIFSHYSKQRNEKMDLIVYEKKYHNKNTLQNKFCKKRNFINKICYL